MVFSRRRYLASRAMLKVAPRLQIHDVDLRSKVLTFNLDTDTRESLDKSMQT